MALTGGVGAAEAARRLSLSPKTLANWILAYRSDAKKFRSSSVVSEAVAEISRLRREIALLKMECDILKKAAALLTYGIHYSMSRKGNCYDNAPMESFWVLLKNKLVHYRHFQCVGEACRAISELCKLRLLQPNTPSGSSGIPVSSPIRTMRGTRAYPAGHLIWASTFDSPTTFLFCSFFDSLHSVVLFGRWLLCKSTLSLRMGYFHFFNV